jgi:hypothetical protein
MNTWQWENNLWFHNSNNLLPALQISEMVITQTIQSRFLKFHAKLYCVDISENVWISEAFDSCVMLRKQQGNMVA